MGSTGCQLAAGAIDATSSPRAASVLAAVAAAGCDRDWATGRMAASAGSGRGIAIAIRQPGSVAESTGYPSAPTTATDQARCRAAAEPRRRTRAARAPAASTTADLADDAMTSQEIASTSQGSPAGSSQPVIGIPPSFSPDRSSSRAGPAPPATGRPPRRRGGPPPPSRASRRRTSARPVAGRCARAAPRPARPVHEGQAVLHVRQMALLLEDPQHRADRRLGRRVGQRGQHVGGRRLPACVHGVHDLPLPAAQRFLRLRSHRGSPLLPPRPPASS